jgi:hypothetical protein
MKVSAVRFTPADKGLRDTGLLGWASILLDGALRAEGIAVRRTRAGTLTLSFPVKDDGYGRRWQYLRPVNEETRQAIEYQVLEQLEWVS